MTSNLPTFLVMSNIFEYIESFGCPVWVTKNYNENITKVEKLKAGGHNFDIKKKKHIYIFWRKKALFLTYQQFKKLKN